MAGCFAPKVKCLTIFIGTFLVLLVLCGIAISSSFFVFSRIIFFAIHLLFLNLASNAPKMAGRLRLLWLGWGCLGFEFHALCGCVKNVRGAGTLRGL